MNGTPASWRKEDTWKHGVCRHPRDKRMLIDDGVGCSACGHIFDPEIQKRGRRNKYRGLSVQRQVALAADMEHIPGNGAVDARDSAFNAEIKSGPAWYSVRVESELDSLPSDRMPLFIAASTPGPGRKRRAYVSVTLGDLVQLIGPHAQVYAWLPDWVALKQGAGVTRK